MIWRIATRSVADGGRETERSSPRTADLMDEARKVASKMNGMVIISHPEVREVMQGFVQVVMDRPSLWVPGIL